MLSSLYQPLVENSCFYRLFCYVIILFILSVLAYLVYLMQMVGLWIVFAGCCLVGLIYCIDLYSLSDSKILAQAAGWITLSNERFQNSSYGVQGDAVVMLTLILPFVLLTWLLYSMLALFGIGNH